MMKRIHGLAGVTGFAVILVFWLSTALSELFGSGEAIAAVKTAILWGMIILIPSLAMAGASGMVMGQRRPGRLAARKKKRMPFIAGNGILILVPAAFYLQSKAVAGQFDTGFFAVQALELLAGAANLTLMGLNIRDGLSLSGRLARQRSRRMIDRSSLTE